MSFQTILTAKAAEVLREAMAANDPNKKIFGKLAIVNRVRGGEVQLRKKESNQSGYKVENGHIVKMTPEEARNRKRSARISARKRKSKMAQILRKRVLSLVKRTNRLG